jgi:hypothetical protein
MMLCTLVNSYQLLYFPCTRHILMCATKYTYRYLCCTAIIYCRTALHAVLPSFTIALPYMLYCHHLLSHCPTCCTAITYCRTALHAVLPSLTVALPYILTKCTTLHYLTISNTKQLTVQRTTFVHRISEIE